MFWADYVVSLDATCVNTAYRPTVPIVEDDSESIFIQAGRYIGLYAETAEDSLPNGFYSFKSKKICDLQEEIIQKIVQPVYRKQKITIIIHIARYYSVVYSKVSTLHTRVLQVVKKFKSWHIRLSLIHI